MTLADLWTVVAPAVADHLWQSTLVMLAVGLTTLVLRRNHARLRYRLWLAASLKFLLPFSLLAGGASRLMSTWTPRGATAQLYLAVTQAGEPFEAPSLPVRAEIPSSAPTNLVHLLPVVLGAVWLCGFVIVLAAWCLRWRKVSAVVGEATPLTEGRAVEVLRRVESIAGVRRPISMLSSPASLEPGIFGIVRPVLLWPEGISEHLDDAQLESIVAHEVWHVRRRDNLAAALHMLIEAAFWFHPLVWWLGARLVDERERACDEEVLRQGSEPAVYAESILKTCRFCVGSQLACVSGVTGADLKRRIAHIMTQSAPHKLNFGRKMLIGIVGLAVLGAPVMFGIMNATPNSGQSIVEVPASLMRALAPTQANQDKLPMKTVSAAPKPLSHKKKACTKSANKAKRVAANSNTPATKP